MKNNEDAINITIYIIIMSFITYYILYYNLVITYNKIDNIND